MASVQWFMRYFRSILTLLATAALLLSHQQSSELAARTKSRATGGIAELAGGARKIALRLPSGHMLSGDTNPSYTYAMSDGVPAPKLIQGPDDEFYVGYNDAESGARLLLLGDDFQVKKEIVHIKNKRLEDLAADDDGVALLLTEFDIVTKNGRESRNFHTAHIEKYAPNGRAIFRTRLVGTREYTKEGDQGIDIYFANFNIVFDEDDDFAAYFTTYRRWDDGVVHQSEYLAFVDADDGERRMRDDGKNAEGFWWNVSHSFRPRFVYDGERYVMATVGDAYPRGFVVQFFPVGKRHMPVKVPKAGPGETYQYVPVSTGDLYSRNRTTFITFDSAVGRGDYDIGLVRVQGDTVSEPIYLTNTRTTRERIPRIVGYGTDRMLIAWMNDSGSAKQKWFPTMNTMSMQAALLDNNGKVIAQPTDFGAKGQFAMRAAARFFTLPDGRVGWLNDVGTGDEQFDLILLPGPNGEGDVSDNEDSEDTNDPDDGDSESEVTIDASLNPEFLQAIYDGKESQALALLKRGADPNAKYGQWTALLYAAYFGQAELVSELVQRGANANAQVQGWTALKLAESRGHSSVAETLRPHTKIASRAIGPTAVPGNPDGPQVRERGARIVPVHQSEKSRGVRELGGARPTE